MPFTISDTNNPLDSIKRFKFITRKGTVNSVFEIAKPHLTKDNYKECYTMLLKKTTYKDLKVYFAKKLIKYFDEQKFTITNPIINQLENANKKAAEINKKKIRPRKIKSKNRNPNKKSFKKQLDRLNGVVTGKKSRRDKTVGGSSEDLTTKSSIWTVKKR